jgi:NADPH-dependent glutamate synthase beta subunit-like oxidoreductase/NAD(P)H-flavin reductase
MTDTAYDFSTGPELTLGIDGFSYPDLYDPVALARLSARFDGFLADEAPGLAERLKAYRSCAGDGMTPEDVSAVLTDAGPFVGHFVARLFNIEDAWTAQRGIIRDEDETIFRYRTEVIAGLAKRFKGVDTGSFDWANLSARVAALRAAVVPGARLPQDLEYLSARAGLVASGKLAPPQGFRAALDSQAALFPELAGDDSALLTACEQTLAQWAHAIRSDASRDPIAAAWVMFKEPAKTDVDHLVHHQINERPGFQTWMAPLHDMRRRDGFKLTDRRMNGRQVLYEVDHCIYCHDRDADSCSKGMRQKKGVEGFKVNALGVTATGCPLGEKISEMHVVKRQGDNIGALALVTVDNPMCPGTGHRICNDCMKGCIYQKTEPVNIPQIETNVLTDVLELPWGFEIYGLLTRWNPLNVKRPHALPYNGRKVLVVGMGPAGYTLSHYLLNEGFGVVGIDALKLEPLPTALTGTPSVPPRPVHDFKRLYDELDRRTVNGFGGVAEYGITVRWDKNFLKVIYLTLLRRQTFQVYGGVRFGGTLTLEDAWDLGFDHVALATGAGKPSVIGLKNNLVRGIRKASDFLMGLQLTGAAKDDSLANMQVRLPLGVIGGGLTAIDTTTELMAYYPKQVEKTLKRYEALCAEHGEETVRKRFDDEETGVLDEFLAHGSAIRAERERARAAGEEPDFSPLVRAWGGVTLFYRKALSDSPAYRQNHEEINEALKEGIEIAAGMNPLEALTDERGMLRAVIFEQLLDDGSKRQFEVPLRGLFIAAGTSPNTIYESENPGTFDLDGKFFARFEPTAATAHPGFTPGAGEGGPKQAQPAPFTSYARNGRYVSFYGDNHPVYAGNVVKAMASAKDGYPYVAALFAEERAKLAPGEQPARDAALRRFFGDLDDAFIARVHEVNRLTPTIIEVVARAPFAARRFEPGQFYRVQNLEALASTAGDTCLATEGLALTGAWVDKEAGLVSLIALEMGTSSRLLQRFQVGEPLVVMGVTGAPTHIPHDQTVAMIGGGLGNAVLFSIGKALRAAGNKVVYFAGYKKSIDVFKKDDIEAAADVVVWSVDAGPGVEAIAPRRPQDRTNVGNVLETMVAYATGGLGEVTIPLVDADELIVIGSDAMMNAVKKARSGMLAPYLKPKHRAIGSINSPMQCMMKGVCAQCMCRHVDPETGKESFVYSCLNQDQPLDLVDFDHLRARLRQNSVQEKLSNLWLDSLLRA